MEYRRYLYKKEHCNSNILLIYNSLCVRIIEKKDFCKMTVRLNGIGNIYIWRGDKNSWENTAPRKYHYLAYQISGCYDHYFSFGQLTATKDKVLFINKNDSYTVKRVETGESICIAIDAEVELSSFFLSASDEPRFENLFGKLYKCANLHLESNRLLAASTVYELFSLVAKIREREYMPSGTVGKVKRALDYIHANYKSEELSCERLSEIAGVGVKHFRNLFKKHCGTTPTQYIIDLRLNAAAELLADGNLSVGAVASAVGIPDQYYFSRLFKARFSVSPSKYH